MKTYILRSQQVHPYINAVTDARYEDALQEAAAVDRFLESVEKSEDQIAEDTPLLGVPFSCKEVLGIKGILFQISLYLKEDLNWAPSDPKTNILAIMPKRSSSYRDYYCFI
ncbi:hypothetical protein TNCV_3151231 [Trichonephila clavipes]|nr:hypothetical protein TNCV_3151231 [Trichonephila clavipes]